MPFSYQDPFEDYKTRLAKKLARRAENANTPAAEETKKDDVNWFGTKIGSDTSALNFGGTGNPGVGKYLNLKRPAASTPSGGGGAGEEPKKKRKTGFGDFEGW